MPFLSLSDCDCESTAMRRGVMRILVRRAAGSMVVSVAVLSGLSRGFFVASRRGGYERGNTTPETKRKGANGVVVFHL